MKKLSIVIVFFIATPVLLLFSSLYFAYNAYNSSSHYLNINAKSNVAFAALPSVQNSFSTNVITQDARLQILKNFLSRYHSPLLPYADNIIKNADKYNLDYRLLPAIAMQESNLCKKAPKHSYNCWGFGIYGHTMTTFKNYPQAITLVTKTLAQDYKAYGFVTPQEIMKRYTPSSNGQWAYSVNFFMNELL